MSPAIESTLVTLAAIVGGFLAVGYCRLVDRLFNRSPLLGGAAGIGGAAAFMWIVMFLLFSSGA